MLDALGPLIQAILESIMASRAKCDTFDELAEAARREREHKMTGLPGDD